MTKNKMERLEKYICVAVAALLLMSGGYFMGRRSPRARPEVVVRTDTLRVRDTLVIDRPVPIDTMVTDTILVAVTDPVIVRERDTVQVRVQDTVRVMVQVPRETKLYGDTTYRAQVSGYRPSLDWIEVYPQTTVVTKTISVDSRKRWGIGVQAGYGAYVAGGQVMLAPYIGIGISYNILSW